MAIYCCKGCVAPKRYPGCHDHCKEYLEQKANNDIQKAERNRMTEISCGLSAEWAKAVSKASRRRRKRK